jgi:predicted AAA+ superfamily ATPase
MDTNFNIPTDLKSRPTYLSQVRPFIGKNLIKVFTGQRRVGKSYLLFQIIQEIIQNEPEATILYINKEDLNFSSIKSAQDLNDYVQQHKNPDCKTYLFIDEIQDIQDFVVVLRSLALDQKLDIYCTGSNANLLSSDVAGFLSGRSIEIKIYSLSYVEFLEFHDLNNSESALELYLKYGGLPYLKHLELSDSIVFEYLKNIYHSIVYRDIINRYEIRNVPFLEHLVQFTTDNVGSILSAKKISDYLKSQKINIAPNQVQLYLGYLVNAFIIHKVPRYDIHGKRIFESGDKFYFENLGIRHGIHGYRLEDRGKILENVVYNHLIYCGYDVKVGVLRNLEIDFVCEKNGEKRYLQVALTIQNEKTFEREFGNLSLIDDHYLKEVVTLDRVTSNSYKGIEHKNLQEFLLES